MFYKEYYAGYQNVKTEEITEDEFNKVHSSVAKFYFEKINNFNFVKNMCIFSDNYILFVNGLYSACNWLGCDDIILFYGKDCQGRLDILDNGYTITESDKKITPILYYKTIDKN